MGVEEAVNGRVMAATGPPLGQPATRVVVELSRREDSSLGDENWLLERDDSQEGGNELRDDDGGGVLPGVAVRHDQFTDE